MSSGKLNLAISGVLLLIYMTIHLFQFRFGVRWLALCSQEFQLVIEYWSPEHVCHPDDLLESTAEHRIAKQKLPADAAVLGAPAAVPHQHLGAAAPLLDE